MKTYWLSIVYLGLFLCGLLFQSGCCSARHSVSVVVSRDVEAQKMAIKRIGIVSFQFARLENERLGPYDTTYSRPKDSGEIAADGIVEIPMMLGYAVVERKQLKVLMDENGLTETDLMKKETVAKAGKTLGMDAVIMGTVSEFGNWTHAFGWGRVVSLNIKCISLETGEVLWSATCHREAQEGYPELLHAISVDAAEKLRKEGVAKGR